MDRCAAHAPGGMLAVAGLDGAGDRRLCTNTGVAVAIRNGIESVVLGGPHGRAASGRSARPRTGRALHAIAGRRRIPHAMDA